MSPAERRRYLSGALASLGGMGEGYAGEMARNASAGATAALDRAERALAAGDEESYALALAVLRDSAQSLQSLTASGVLGGAEAANAAELVGKLVGSMPAKALSLPEGFTVRNGLVEREEENVAGIKDSYLKDFEESREKNSIDNSSEPDIMSH